MMKLKFKALQQPKRIPKFANNHFRWFVIETLIYNYDGKGGVMVLNDGKLDTMTNKDLLDMMYGGWYELIELDGKPHKVDRLIPVAIEEDWHGMMSKISFTLWELKTIYNLLVTYYPDHEMCEDFYNTIEDAQYAFNKFSKQGKPND